MNWKALLKIATVAAGGAGLTEASKAVTQTSGWEIAGQLLTIAGIIGAYMLEKPTKKPDTK